jgi:hypothetical protein
MTEEDINRTRPTIAVRSNARVLLIDLFKSSVFKLFVVCHFRKRRIPFLVQVASVTQPESEYILNFRDISQIAIESLRNVEHTLPGEPRRQSARDQGFESLILEG